jgi:hypothetical protein
VSRPSKLRLAQVSIGVLLLVIIRSLSEVLRLHYLHGEALVVGQVTPYVVGALLATVALALTVVCFFASLYRAATAIAATTLILMLIYKVAVVG